jgi:hypothetical protein
MKKRRKLRTLVTESVMSGTTGVPWEQSTMSTVVRLVHVPKYSQ